MLSISVGQSVCRSPKSAVGAPAPYCLNLKGPRRVVPPLHTDLSVLHLTDTSLVTSQISDPVCSTRVIKMLGGDFPVEKFSER